MAAKGGLVGTIGLWLWHLLPANPILVRVVHGASRRPRHLLIRGGYLGILLFVVLISVLSSIAGQTRSLSELAKGASQTFMIAAMTQLALMCFLAPVFTAGAITQERDAQTFNILLTTPLSNAQIVLGTLMSRLFFVLMLLFSGLPIFLFTMIYGGVTATQIMESFAISASTAIVTAALAILVSMVRVGTRRTIFTFYLAIAMYMLGVYMLGRWDQTLIADAPANISGRKMSALAPTHPFLALEIALNLVEAPSHAHLGGYSSFARYALTHPSGVYVGCTLAAATIMIVISMFFVRRNKRDVEEPLLARISAWLRRKEVGERVRVPQNVWRNPVAWREARTRAVGGSWMRWVIISAGLIGSVILFVMHVGGGLDADLARAWLSGLVLMQFSLAILVATNVASTSMTREKESQTIDLLLTTTLTSRYILWGKLRGLVSFGLPLVLGPMAALLLFGVYGLWGSAQPPAVLWESSFEVGALMIIYIAVACVIGLQTSLRARKTVIALMQSMLVLILLAVVASTFAIGIIEAGEPRVGAFAAPFSPISSILYLIDTKSLFDDPTQFAAGLTGARVSAAFGTVIATGFITLIVWSVYQKLVRDFDMIIRKQSGT